MKVSLSKYQACLLGGAIGDALGAPIEFLSIGQIRALSGPDGLNHYIEFSDGTGAFTDDTQMTLFTAEALLRAYHKECIKGIPDAMNTIAHHSYLRWYHTQTHPYTETITNKAGILNGWLVRQQGLYRNRAPGNTCLSALRSGKAGTIEKPINDSKGCGTVMRMAPVGLMYFGQNEEAFRIACELSAITHGHPTGYLSAGFFASVISDLAVGITLELAIHNAIRILEDQEHHHETLAAVQKALLLFRKTKAGNSPPTPETYEKLGEGWVAEEALAMALFAALSYPDDFREGVLLALNHSGDCDSTASITGNLLGLMNGVKSIPATWIDNLRERRLVNQMAVDLFLRVKGGFKEEDPEWSEKYPPG
ncbi:MAG: ADP-ribosylglycohydrolase family protein [Flavobacteriaceae bacterium]|nr:ADP-ribosylglycohydrolase family protein [Flavobacteriaceae bacterium]